MATTGQAYWVYCRAVILYLDNALNADMVGDKRIEIGLNHCIVGHTAMSVHRDKLVPVEGLEPPRLVGNAF